MKAYYQSTIKDFIFASNEEVLGALSVLHFQKLEHQQTRAWSFQIDYLQSQLRADWNGKIYFEFMIPRMGKRADCVIHGCCKTIASEFPDLENGFMAWEASGYMPTPTIIEAVQALFSSHGVQDIARSDAGAKNLTNTTDEIFKIVEKSKSENKNSICFVTGVPGAGKTLAGLNIATSRSDLSSLI